MYNKDCEEEMKLRNKKTDRVLTKYSVRVLEGVDADKGNERIILIDDETGKTWEYYSWSDFNADWEDHEGTERIVEVYHNSCSPKFVMIEMGTKEEAEKAVEKLKAWKRLRDKGFKFTGINEQYVWVFEEPYRDGDRKINFNKSEDDEWLKENWDDLHLLFGGK